MLGIDSHLVGGECPYYGCIPSKMIIRAADVLEEARPRRPAGRDDDGRRRTTRSSPTGSATRRPTTGTTRSRSIGTPTKAAPSSAAKGDLTAPDAVVVGDERYTARRGRGVGHWHFAGDSAGPRPRRVGAVDQPRHRQGAALPDSLIVLGGGAIGLELAQAFPRFGCQVTIIEAADRILAPEEPETASC